MKFSIYKKHENEKINYLLQTLSLDNYIFLSNDNGSIEYDVSFNYLINWKYDYDDYIRMNKINFGYLYLIVDITIEDNSLCMIYLYLSKEYGMYKPIIEQHHINIRNENFDKLLK